MTNMNRYERLDAMEKQIDGLPVLSDYVAARIEFARRSIASSRSAEKRGFEYLAWHAEDAASSTIAHVRKEIERLNWTVS